MIIEINKENLNILINSFIDIDYLGNELKNNPYAKILILKEENEIIGYIYYSKIYERTEINNFEISKEYRNNGKGNILLKRMIEDSKGDITLEVRENNYSAIHLYEKNGFEKKAIRKGYYNGIDGLLMERKYTKDSH